MGGSALCNQHQSSEVMKMCTTVHKYCCNEYGVDLGWGVTKLSGPIKTTSDVLLWLIVSYSNG